MICAATYCFYVNFPFSIHISVPKVPATIRARPAADFAVSFSLNTMREKRTVTSMLSLSMGTTAVAGPFCKALK